MTLILIDAKTRTVNGMILSQAVNIRAAPLWTAEVVTVLKPDSLVQVYKFIINGFGSS